MGSGRKHAPTSAPGALIGEYRVERLLGEGSMGAVYAAIHTVIDKRVALKVLRRELCAKETFVERFIKEARAVNRIGHPNIIDVFGFGTTDDGRVFLAMELLEGTSLADRLESAMELSEVCDIGIEIAHALEAAHTAGIVHRDLKPDNVFLATTHERSKVKLLDFGIAKLTGEGAGSAMPTQPGALLGTPTYIAPEQARGDAIDGRSDVYALGVMLFEMFAGRPPFVGTNAVEVASMHISEPPPVPSTIAPALPRLVDTLLAGMLDKNPARRPRLAQVREALEELRVESGAGESGVFSPPPLQPRDDVDDVDDPGSTAASLAAIRTRRWPVFVLGLLALVLGFGLVVKLWPYLAR